MNHPDEAPRVDAALLEKGAEELYEDAPCGYVSTLPDGTIVRVNRTLLDLFVRSAPAGRGKEQRQSALNLFNRPPPLR